MNFLLISIFHIFSNYIFLRYWCTAGVSFSLSSYTPWVSADQTQPLTCSNWVSTKPNCWNSADQTPATNLQQLRFRRSNLAPNLQQLSFSGSDPTANLQRLRFSRPNPTTFFLTVYLSKQDNDNMYKTGRTDITSPLFSEKRQHLEIHKIHEAKKTVTISR
jgi:hypothetical protein